MPESFEYANNGGRKYLLRNMGDGKFRGRDGEGRAEQPSLDTRRCRRRSARHGLPGHRAGERLRRLGALREPHGKKFREVGGAAGIGVQPQERHERPIGDILNQGKYCIYVSNISEDGNLIQGNNLWVPKDRSPGGTLQYDNLARDLGVELGGWSFGAQFGDLNNDGYLDIYLVNGFISAEQDPQLLVRLRKVALGQSNIIGDAANWPAMHGQSLSGYQQKHVWLNDGAGRFNEVAQLVGAKDLLDGRAVAIADFQNDGMLDVVSPTRRDGCCSTRTPWTRGTSGSSSSWRGRRATAARSAPKFDSIWNGQQQLQEVSGGSGFCSQNQRRLHFGLGKDPHVEKAVIRWPSGTVQTLTAPELQIGEVHKVKEL